MPSAAQTLLMADVVQLGNKVEGQRDIWAMGPYLPIIFVSASASLLVVGSCAVRVPSKPIASQLVGPEPRALLSDCREPSSSC
ncbi:hypothetical protein HDV63DRAFT_176080 [Trichoderma sp. SZMC 28014]